MSTLGGGGGQCTIPEGTPTPERRRLLQRQSLELALYTYKYADCGTVITTLPPTEVPSTGTQSSGTALYFRKDDFSRELDRPLARTLLSASRARPRARADAAERHPSGHGDRRHRGRDDRPSHRQAPLQLRVHARPGGERDHGAHSRPVDGAAALARAKARLDTLDLYPQPVRIDGVCVVVAPWFFRLPRLRRYRG